MALSLDGHALGADNANTVVLTNSTANSLIFVASWHQVSVTISSIADSSGQGLTWVLLGTTVPAGGLPIEVWWTKAPVAFSGVTITITYSGAPSANKINAFAVTGQDQTTSTSWKDGTATFNGGAGSAVGNLTYTSTNANVMVFDCARFASTANPTAGASWTLIDAADFMGNEYQLPPNTAGTVFTGTYTTGNGDQSGNVMFAIVATAVASTPPPGSQLNVFYA